MTWSRLREEAAALSSAAPELAPALACLARDAGLAEALADLVARLLPPLWLEREALRRLAREVFAQGEAGDIALADLETITRLNFEPGGLAASWIGARGFHMLLAHRVAHELWRQGRRDLSTAVKTAAAALGADIHPAARIGRRIFLDHGIGVVIGETAVIEDDVCLWHGVTLGSTLMQEGDRHPKLRRGVVVGAGATILGNIEVGEGSVVASGSVVLAAVPPFTTVAGNPAVPRARHRHPYGYGRPSGGGEDKAAEQRG